MRTSPVQHSARKRRLIPAARRGLWGGLRLSGPGFALFLIVATALLALSVIIAVGIGAVRLSPEAVVAALLDDTGGVHQQIVRELRLPRVLLAAVIGGALAAVGAALQAVMRSALADPYILGVSSGASVGAALVMVTGAFSALGHGAVAAAAFCTGLISVLVVYTAARVQGRVPSIRLLLAGVAWSSFATALTGFILYTAPEAAQVRGVVFWMMGGLGGADWAAAAWTALIAGPGCLALLATARWQNLLLLGDEAATALGLDVARARGVLVVLAALITGTAVAFSGAIGFVGLVVPHALRPFTGPDHRRLVPASLVAGALMLVWMDAAARSLMAPRELPVGLLTGLLGAPFFLLLLRRQHGDALE